MTEFAKSILTRLFPELVSYLPLIPLLQAITAAKDPHAKSLAILDLVRFGAGRTKTELDEQLVSHMDAVMRTPQGAAFANWLSENLTSGVFQMEMENTEE